MLPAIDLPHSRNPYKNYLHMHLNFLERLKCFDVRPTRFHGFKQIGRNEANAMLVVNLVICCLLGSGADAGACHCGQSSTPKKESSFLKMLSTKFSNLTETNCG